MSVSSSFFLEESKKGFGFARVDGDGFIIPADDVAVVTVNRPEALNALSKDILEELGTAFAAIEKNEAVACVILTGSGAKAFVAGADIAAMQSMNAVAAEDFARLGHAVLSAIENFPKPVIAAVNGFARVVVHYNINVINPITDGG